MKARIHLNDKFSSKQKADMRRLVELEMQKQSKEIVRKILKLVCISLNDELGVGAKRLKPVLVSVQDLANEHFGDEDYWYKVDKRVIETMGIEFEREKYPDLF